VPCPASLTTGTRAGVIAPARAGEERLAGRSYLSRGNRVATCVTGKASANDTKDKPSATVKAALLTSS
jgi:hypothetical protein